MKQLICRECQKEFEREVYCSAACRTKFHNKRRSTKGVVREVEIVNKPFKYDKPLPAKVRPDDWEEIKKKASFL